MRINWTMLAVFFGVSLAVEYSLREARKWELKHGSVGDPVGKGIK